MAGKVNENNIFLINAPAGSGKTTRIKSMIMNHSVEHSNDNILCITYTNRAADEIKSSIKSSKIYVGTIHSFLHDFIRVYFAHEKVIELYFATYSDNIQHRISNIEKKETIEESNKKYKEKFGELNLDIIKKNLNHLYYNETRFDSLYSGGLSHDTLITFVKIIFDKFPIIKKRINYKYQVIFIDEYQDTSADILEIFHQSVIGTDTKLYLLGDKMQQIYKNYDGSFEDEFAAMNRSIVLNTNHRSIPVIVDILNELYNDSTYNQKKYIQENDCNHMPRIILCENIGEALKKEQQLYPKALALFLFNKEKFDAIGAGQLYTALDAMEAYKFYQQSSAVDILSNPTSDNPDPLIKLLFILSSIIYSLLANNLGAINKTLNSYPKIFDDTTCSLTKHSDKQRLHDLLSTVREKYENDESSIRDILNILQDSKLVQSAYIDSIISNDDYFKVISITIREFKKIGDYLSSPQISTQHGVKGESHETVFFVAADSNSVPLVHMYNFFDLWCTTDISLSEFENFYYKYNNFIKKITEEVDGFQPTKIKAPWHTKNKEVMVEKASNICTEFKGNQIFMKLCYPYYEDYLSTPNVKNINNCFKGSIVFGALSAYRLFYVGCSRARKNLSIFIDRTKIKSYSENLQKKFKEIGFEIEFR